MGRVFLFELTRHSDHHAHATRPFPVLRHHDEAPELPHGYPAMVLAALVPPLFFGLMHPALDGWRARQSAPVAA
jgi:alkane 1-monooxygenase